MKKKNNVTISYGTYKSFHHAPANLDSELPYLQIYAERGAHKILPAEDPNHDTAKLFG